VTLCFDCGQLSGTNWHLRIEDKQVERTCLADQMFDIGTRLCHDVAESPDGVSYC